MTEELEFGISDFWPLSSFYFSHHGRVYPTFKMIFLFRVIIPEEKMPLNAYIITNIHYITNIYYIITNIILYYN